MWDKIQIERRCSEDDGLKSPDFSLFLLRKEIMEKKAKKMGLPPQKSKK